MGTYLINFSVYMFAMIGILYFAVSVYKKTNVNTNVNNGFKQNKKSTGMQIEESLALSPRKRLHVLKVNGQRFLIAADADRTEFLATLADNADISSSMQEEKETTEVQKNPLMDFPKMINPINLIKKYNTTNISGRNNKTDSDKKTNTINFVKNNNVKCPDKKQTAVSPAKKINPASPAKKINPASFMRKINPANINKKLNQPNNGKVAQFSSKLQEKVNRVAVEYGSSVLKGTPQKYQTTRLTDVKNINMKKPPVMRELLRKLAV